LTDTFAVLGITFSPDGRVRHNLGGVAVRIGADPRKDTVNPNIGNADVTEITLPDGSVNSYVKMGIGVRIRPNFGKKMIYFYLCLNEGLDEYDFLVSKTWGFKSKVMRDFRSVPLDCLVDLIDETYNELIKTECDGFIPC
jgi:hypothetical protein